MRHDQHSRDLFAFRSLNQYGNFSAGTSAVLNRHRDQNNLAGIVEQRPHVGAIYAELRKPAITVYPVVEEPFQIALPVRPPTDF